MNLVTDAWVPILKLKLDGKPNLASLRQIFVEGNQYADLAVRPHERIALMRFLICIAQAALDGPKNIQDWDAAPERLPEAADSYLFKCQQSFSLFDSDLPFLQIAGLRKPLKGKIGTKGGDAVNDFNPTSKLDFALASQHNSTLFDHEASSIFPRSFSPPWIARNLLTFQNFSSSGRIGVASWKNTESQGGGSSQAAPCLKNLSLHTFVRKATLLNTVCANLVTKKQVANYLQPCQWGKPIWEQFPKSPNDSSAIANLTGTYLGRLVPLSRWIKIHSQGDHMILANGFSYLTYPDFPAECTTTEIVNKGKNERSLLKVDDKGIWRQLHAILVKYARQKGGRSPLCIENQSENDTYDIWVGGISWSSEGGYIDVLESVYKIVPELKTDVGVATYEQEVLYANRIGSRLSAAVREYRKHLDGELAKIDQEKNKKRKRELSQTLERIASATAGKHFWTSLERLLPLLMAHVQSLGTTVEVVKSSASDWRKAVHAAALDAYRITCGQETCRQMRAFAMGWDKLFVTQTHNDTSDNAKSEAAEE
jgi:CRISPR system Cascade subunit CasA